MEGTTGLGIVELVEDNDMERRRKVPWGVGQRKCLPLTFTGKRTGRDVKAANHPLTTNETPHPVRSVIAAVARLFPRLFHVEWRSTTEPVLVLPNVRRLTTALRVVFGHYVVFEASDFGNSDSSSCSMTPGLQCGCSSGYFYRFYFGW